MSDASYIVLARKHRPQQLADVVGQEHVAQTLANAIGQNRVAHALLFTGPRGVGKTSTARILTRALNCHHGPTPTPCGECPACLEIADGSSVDVIEIDAASNRGIDEIRELRDAVRYPPSRERYKVYIIDEVHMLTTPAFNALLKTLEEPPPQVVFIFATTEPHKIPDTILSRCQRYDFRRIPVPRIVEHLTRLAELEGVQADPEALRLIARQAEGCMRDAQSLMDQLISFSDGHIDAKLAARVLGAVGRDALFRLSDVVLTGDVDGVLTIVDEAYQIGINLVRLATDFLEHLRDLTVSAVTRGPSALLHLTDSERERLASQVAGRDPSVMHRMFAILLETAEEMSKSSHPRLMLEMALIRMTAIEPVEPLGSLMQRLDGYLSGAPVAAPTRSSQSVRPAPGTPQRHLEGGAPTGQLEAGAPTGQLEAGAPKGGAPKGGAPTGQLVAGAPKAGAPRAGAPAGQLAASNADHATRWRQLVEAIAAESQVVASFLKEARLLPGDDHHFAVCLSGAQYDIIRADDKQALVARVAHQLYGAGARVELRSEGRPTGRAEGASTYSISRAEDKERALELERLGRVVADHPVTHLVRDVFELEDNQIRIVPQLVDSDNLAEPET